ARSSRTDHRRHQRDDSAHHHLLAKEIARIGEGSDPRSLLRIRGEARAGGIDEPDHWNALAQRQLAQPRHLPLADGTDAAAHDGEVIRSDAHRPGLDESRAADDAVRRRGRVQLAQMRSQEPDFTECFWIEQKVEAGSGVELSTLLLTRETRLAAHF